MGHCKERRTAVWDMGKEDGLLDGTLQRKTDCCVGHGKGRRTTRWDTAKEDGLLCGTWERKTDY